MLEYLKAALDKLPNRRVENQWRVEEAERLLKNELIQEFFGRYREHLQSLWCNSSDIDEREELHRLYKTCGRFEQDLKSYLMYAKLHKLNQ